MLGLLAAVEGGEGEGEMVEMTEDDDDADDDADDDDDGVCWLLWWLPVGPMTARRTGITKRPCHRPKTTVRRNTCQEKVY